MFLATNTMHVLQFAFLIIFLSYILPASDVYKVHVWTGIFLPSWSWGQGPVEFWKKSIWTIKIGKIWCNLKELACHLKWIKNHYKKLAV